MKYFYFCISAVLVMACSNIEPVRRVEKNVFHATNPDLTVTIDKHFSFEDEGTSGGYQFFPGYTAGSNVKTETFTFVNAKEQRAVLIEFNKLLGRAHWKTELNNGIDNIIDKGHETIAGRDYQYAVFTTKDEDGSCLLIKRFANIYGTKKNIYQTILYIQAIKEKLGPCDLWRNPAVLGSAQRDFLNLFLQNCARDIIISG